METAAAASEGAVEERRAEGSLLLCAAAVDTVPVEQAAALGCGIAGAVLRTEQCATVPLLWQGSSAALFVAPPEGTCLLDQGLQQLDME